MSWFNFNDGMETNAWDTQPVQNWAGDPYYNYRHTLPCGCPHPWPHNSIPCVLNQPMGIVISPEGVHLSCPAHPAGHRIYGTQITC